MSGNAVVNNDKPVLAPASIALTASKSRQIPTKSYWIVVGVGALVFTLLKWVYFKPPTDRERA